MDINYPTMKHLLITVLAVSVLALTGCKDEEVIPSLKGTVWSLTFDWDPQNPPDGDGTAVITFKADGTFIVPSEGASGTWTQDGKNMSFTFTSGGSAVYTGTISGDAMSGTSTDGAINGTWKAVRF